MSQFRTIPELAQDHCLEALQLWDKGGILLFGSLTFRRRKLGDLIRTYMTRYFIRLANDYNLAVKVWGSSIQEGHPEAHFIAHIDNSGVPVSAVKNTWKHGNADVSEVRDPQRCFDYIYSVHKGKHEIEVFPKAFHPRGSSLKSA